MKRAILLFAAVAWITPAFAEDDPNAGVPGYYRSTMPDGRVVFGDKPAKGADQSVFVPLQSKETNVIKIAPTNSTEEPRSKRNAVDNDIQQRAQTLNAAAAELERAQQELAEAQAALADGQAPQEGERTGTAVTSCVTHKDGTRSCTTSPSGSTQLNEAYFNRIKQLQDNVTAAEQRVHEAQQRVNDARY